MHCVIGEGLEQGGVNCEEGLLGGIAGVTVTSIRSQTSAAVLPMHAGCLLIEW